MFDRRVFEFIARLTPSRRGELEIADVHNRYILEGDLCYDVLEGAWSDAGTFESLLRANELVARRRGSVENR
jgi:glucose-1-phosphate thymidylyltransferase